jgi:hypothetical protein
VVFLTAFQQKISAMWFKVASVVGTILVIPSLVLRVSPALGASIGPALVPLAFVGVIGALIAFLGLITYLAWGQGAEKAAIGYGVGMEAVVTETYGAPPMTPPSMPAYTPPTPAVSPPVAPATVPAMDVPETAVVPPIAETKIMRAAPKEMAMLVIRSGPRAGQSFSLQAITNIGRDPQRNEISLDDKAMSRENTRIKLEDGQFVIYDLASTNGTFVNGEKILKRVLSNGDEVQIGDTHFAFVEIKPKEKP